MADLDDLEDLGGALAADGARVTRELPPVVRMRARAGSGAAKPAQSGVEDVEDDPVRASDSFGDATSDSAAATFVSRMSERDTDAPSRSPSIPGRGVVHVKTFGCSHNVSDSEFMAGQLGA
jgi:threonylcarbamoyladenosine tRNA methylthiotransferase CDKAL1